MLVVEHDPAVIRAADWTVDIGPRRLGTAISLVFCGSLGDLLRADTATSRALNDQDRPRRAAAAGPSTTRSASRTRRPTTCATSPSGVETTPRSGPGPLTLGQDLLRYTC